MEFISDSSIPEKLKKMQERVQWKHPIILDLGIDQTSLVLDDGKENSRKFAFIAMGDTGGGPDLNQNSQRAIAQAILANLEDCRFILHTGDLVYQVGSREYYQKNFIEPYRELIEGGDQPEKLAYDRLIFNIPFLPVLGNHDYYDLSWLGAFLTQVTTPLRSLMGLPVELNLGWEGSKQGDVFARAFLDYLARFSSSGELLDHLERHYTAKTATGQVLNYQPQKFTRLPNRYYHFTSGDMDFFALDSNTFNSLDGDVDLEQLEWVEQRLIDSWYNREIRGRVIYFHHPPYVTEINKYNQKHTLAVRQHLRSVLDRVAKSVGSFTQGRPLVDLIIGGHAHCLEYLQTENTGHADSYLNWLVCGGSGFGLRRQSPWGSQISETGKGIIARSRFFLGCSGFGTSVRYPYSAVRIEVDGSCPPQFLLRPIVRESFQGQWCDRPYQPLTLRAEYV